MGPAAARCLPDQRWPAERRQPTRSEFETNAPVGAYPGLVRYVDLLWRGLRKGVAVNRWIWHSRRDQFQRDHDTAGWLRLDHGIEILPVTARDCIHATPGTVARVLRFLGC